MGFYSLNPEQMKDIQSPDAGELLRRDGSNIASVVSRLETDRPEIKARIAEYLTAIVPDIQDFERLAIGHKETLRFKQAVKGSQYPWWFSAASVSDGTLRSLGILVAAMQLVKRQAPIQLVGLEEPESALHPAAAGALMDSLREAACHTQILLTTHSPDVLERVDLEEESLLVVQSRQGETQIAPADSASLKMIREHLYSAGELLRMDQLQPDEESVQRQLQWDS
jgi:predicted ATPase